MKDHQRTVLGELLRDGFTFTAPGARARVESRDGVFLIYRKITRGNHSGNSMLVARDDDPFEAACLFADAAEYEDTMRFTNYHVVQTTILNQHPTLAPVVRTVAVDLAGLSDQPEALAHRAFEILAKAHESIRAVALVDLEAFLVALLDPENKPEDVEAFRTALREKAGI